MVVIPGNSHESPLVHYLRGERKPRMPLDATPLTEAQLGAIQRWIDQLPEEEPLKALKQAEKRAALAEKELAWARANLPAVEARILAERAKNADPPDSNAQALAEAAHRAERQANLIKAESKLAQAQQVLAEALKAPDADESNARKRIAEARKQLESAQQILTQSLEGHTPLGKSYPATSSGRRLALARWIASRDNPLTARVAINHIWLRHFGQPLVQTVSNFGVSGRPPTHPALLDWLASELVERNWSVKSIHRLIVTSDAYRRRSSTADPRRSQSGHRSRESLPLAHEPPSHGSGDRAGQSLVCGRGTGYDDGRSGNRREPG